MIITGALIYFLSLATEMSVFVTNMASMIGIGVAVDYSLFVLARYREEVRAGRAPDEARGVALATSGLAVIFSGLTVIASLAGLFLINTTALRSMAIGAILVVSVAMLAAATLLPVLISLLGKRAWAPGGIVGNLLGRRRVRSNRPHDETFWGRWTAARHEAPGRRRRRRERRPARPRRARARARRRRAARSTSSTTTTRRSRASPSPRSSAAAATGRR